MPDDQLENLVHRPSLDELRGHVADIIRVLASLVGDGRAATRDFDHVARRPDIHNVDAHALIAGNHIAGRL